MSLAENVNATLLFIELRYYRTLANGFVPCLLLIDHAYTESPLLERATCYQDFSEIQGLYPRVG